MTEAFLATAFGFALVLFRTAGLCTAAPVLGSHTVPMRIRMALALALSFVAFSGAGAPAVAPPDSLLQLAASGVAETAIGLVAGLSARMVLEAASTAGHIAGLSMGLGYSSLLDPFTGNTENAVSQLLSLAALATAVGLGIHREAFSWLCESVVVIPPGGSLDLAALASNMIAHAVLAIGLAIRLAFPILAAITLGHFVLATMGRVAPQLNLQSVGFSVAILAGGGALYLVTPSLAKIAAQAAVATFSHG